MINILPTQDGFALTYQEKTILSHTFSHPCIGMGTGRADITMEHGMYRIKEKQSIRWEDTTPITINRSEGMLLISFGNVFTLRLEETGQALRLTPIPSPNLACNRFFIRLQLPVGEPVFGCGEQFSHLDLRGKVLPLWVSEPGIGRGPNYVRVLADLHSGRGGSQAHTYFPQASYVTYGGQWTMVDTTAFSRFDFSGRTSCVITTHAIPTSILIGQTHSLATATAAISNSIGRQKALPDWIYQGIILGLQGGRSSVEQKLQVALKAGIPVTAVWCQDWQGIRMTPYGKQLFWNWEYDRTLYPDLPEFIKSLHERGIRFLGYTNPFLSTDAPLYQEGAKKGYFVHDSKHQAIYVTSTTTFPVAMIDLCNPEACTWYRQIIKRNMLAIGMDGWMADFGEYLPPDGALYEHANPAWEHNRYPVRWAQLNAQAVQEAGRSKEVVYFCRSGFTGSAPAVPLVWAGDQLVNFLKDSGLPSVIPAGISSSLSGIGYWHFDIGGFFSFAWIKRSRALLMQSCELAAFTQVMRTHEGINPTVNAQFDSDPQMLSHFARMTRIHAALLAYHQLVSQRYQESGIPPIQPVVCRTKTGLRAIPGHYLYGEDLLIAPRLKRNVQKQTIWLGEGSWVDFWTGKPYTQGRHRVRSGPGRPPVFIRSESSYLALCRQIAQKECE
ncbi:MAG: alpha-glucosidase [Sphaerochaeta sp.]|uniref:alpha-glucosidase n=1 Tax=Sphaerochaeta sp. TaxID=1972642 RepID=UPI003D125837